MGGMDEHQSPQVVGRGQHREQLIGIPIETVDVAPHHHTNEAVVSDAPLQFGNGCSRVLQREVGETGEPVGMGCDHLGEVVICFLRHRYAGSGVELVPVHQRAQREDMHIDPHLVHRPNPLLGCLQGVRPGDGESRRSYRARDPSVRIAPEGDAVTCLSSLRRFGELARYHMGVDVDCSRSTAIRSHGARKLATGGPGIGLHLSDPRNRVVER